MDSSSDDRSTTGSITSGAVFVTFFLDDPSMGSAVLDVRGGLAGGG